MIAIESMSEENRQIDEISEAFEQEFGRFADLNLDGIGVDEAEALLREIGELKIRHSGKKSKIAEAKKLIGKVAPEERGAFGQLVQSAENNINSKISEAEAQLKEFISKAKTESERLDVTIPGRRPRTGHLHPITIVRQKIEDIFVSMGYAIEDDREIENDYYNFDALNIPEGHPARESQDTFYTTDGFALRSQTSTVQIRAMERRGAPIRILAPGRVFRRDTPDMTHTPMFHQLEGLCVDKDITMAHLKGTVTEWHSGSSVRIRERGFARPTSLSPSLQQNSISHALFVTVLARLMTHAAARARVPVGSSLAGREWYTRMFFVRVISTRPHIPASHSDSASNAWPR